jgi:hypothetical protein
MHYSTSVPSNIITILLYMSMYRDQSTKIGANASTHFHPCPGDTFKLGFHHDRHLQFPSEKPPDQPGWHGRTQRGAESMAQGISSSGEGITPTIRSKISAAASNQADLTVCQSRQRSDRFLYSFRLSPQDRKAVAAPIESAIDVMPIPDQIPIRPGQRRSAVLNQSEHDRRR